MRKHNKNYRPSRTILSLAMACVPLWSVAQPALEEVLVTATKREIGMQDVPIALSVMTGEKILEQGIGSLEDLAVFMPNVHIAEAGGGDVLFIRGVGSGVNYGFEQSVGTFIDGVYFGRGQASRSMFLDVARVEVLKGPQSTLFGKNTVAGAINITTARPGDAFEAIVEGTVEPEFDGWSTTLTLSGPVTDTFGVRFVVKREETDGYMENTFQNRDERQEENTVGRVVLDWQASDTLDVLFKYERGESDTTGRQNLISVASAAATEIYRGVDPDFQAKFGYQKSAANIGGIRSDTEFHDANWDIATLTIDWDMGGHSLRSITAYVNYEFENYRDTDYGPLRFLGGGTEEDHEQFTQELLLSSPTGGVLEYLAGVYYQDEDLSNNRFGDAVLSGGGFGDGNLDGTNYGTFDQTTETWSTFAQLTWNVSNTFRLIGGLRYSSDKKEFSKTQWTADLFTTNLSPFLGGFYDQVLNFTTDHSFGSKGATRCVGLAYVCTDFPDFDNKRDEEHWTGDLTVQWDISDSTMTYAKIGNGYKAGGFDETNLRGVLEAEEFADESVEGVEVGAKMNLWDNRARLNIAAFYNEFDDVQVSTFDGNAGFTVGNAAKSTTRGIEADGSIAITDNFVATVAIAWLDASYDSFRDAACNELQVLDWIASGGARTSCVQDLSGDSLQFSPEWSGNLALDYTVPLSASMAVKLGADMLYSDSYEVAADHDKVLRQSSFYKINARVQLFSVEDGWSVAILGKNLTDEKTSNWGNDVPLAGSGFSQTYYQLIDAPRSFVIQARYSF